MEPLQDMEKSFMWPKGRRWSFRSEGTRYVVRLKEDGCNWTLRFKRNGLKVRVSGRDLIVHTVSVNGITWEYFGSYSPSERGWYAVEQPALPEGLPPKVVEVANQAISLMEAYLTPIQTEQAEQDRAREMARRRRINDKNQARWAKQEEHLSEVLERLG